jgi:hypothetical protein
MKPSELIDYLVEFYKEFNPNTESIESYFQTYSKTKPVENEGDFEFIKNVIDGYLRFKGFLDIIVNKFVENIKSALKSDFNLYIIFSYLSLFALDELGFDNFKLFIKPGKVFFFFCLKFLDNKLA